MSNMFAFTSANCNTAYKNKQHRQWLRGDTTFTFVQRGGRGKKSSSQFSLHKTVLNPKVSQASEVPSIVCAIFSIHRLQLSFPRPNGSLKNFNPPK